MFHVPVRRRRLLVAAVFLLALAGIAAGVVAARSPSGANSKLATPSLPGGARWCGYLEVGIGWRVWASPALSCRSGRTFMRAYMRPGQTAAEMFRGYACATRGFPLGVGYSCVRGQTSVIAIANH